MKKKSVAVVIITNGPGELSTWVKPVLDTLIQQIESTKTPVKVNLSFRLVLVPCPNGTGKESEVAKSWKIFDLITKSKVFWKLLVYPANYGKWPKKGVVVFLGGDQFWSVLLAKRLGYKNITYAEWISRWPRWNDKIAAMNREVKKKLPKRYENKCEIIGDLMADIKNNRDVSLSTRKSNWIALLPGSKKSKLSIGIPFFLEMADHMAEKNEKINLIIPIAPTTNINEYIFYQSDKNPISKFYSSRINKIKNIDNSVFDYYIETSKNTKIYLIKKHPCYEVLKSCNLAVTTVGANTAELAALNLPMIVVLPTQHLNVMKSWDGILGILGKFIFINKLFTLVVKNWYLKNKKFFAWPNIKAKRMIVPERIGNISPKEIAKEVIFLLNNKKILNEQKNNLLMQRGGTGAVEKLSYIILNLIKQIN